MGRAHKFRFGVAARANPASAAEWQELATQVEALGYSSLLVGDHFVDGDNPPSIIALAWAAAVTDSLRVGTLVLGNDYRHPAVVAKDAATLDMLSNGRLEFGLGAGWLRADYEALGLEYDPPTVRVDRLAEALEVIKLAWSGVTFDFTGVHYTIRGCAGLPVPIQAPRPPVVVGGGSPRVLRLAGRHADIVGLLQASMQAEGPNSDELMSAGQDAQMRRKIGWVKEGAGERFDELELQMMYWVTITDDPRAAADLVASAAGLSVDEVLSSGMRLLGSVDEICHVLERRREEWGVSYIVVSAEGFSDFAPVVARLAGT